MKLFGLIIIVIGNFILLLNYETSKKKKILSSKDLVCFIQYLNTNVLECKMTLPDAIYNLKGRISDYIDSFIRITDIKNEKITVRQTILTSMKTYFSDCDAELLKCVTDYINILGTTDKKTMYDNYNVIYNECTEIIEKLKNEYRKNIKLTTATVFGISSIAVLMLI